MLSARPHITLGMAGHIDHGKTALVMALTGIDTDRLKEEKERGMTTDLGFAFLGDEIAIIDVPGHERFVRTMVAGVHTVDAALLVIAADDGVMPQTREHLEILQLLGIPVGLIALNKVDLVDEEWLAMVRADIASLVAGTFLEKAPVLPVSAVTGRGIPALRESILGLTTCVRGRKDRGVFRMPIDRVFTIRGFGTVVAGTILAGRVHTDEQVELLPEGRLLRVRGIQVHDASVEESGIGQRTAINVQGLEKEMVQRGDTLAAPGFLRTTFMLDARMTMLRDAPVMEQRQRVHLHLGTGEAVGRVVLLGQERLGPGQEGFLQFHLERPIVAESGDRFIVRSYSPMQSLGGGTVLDAHPEKHKRSDAGLHQRLERAAAGDPADALLDHLDRFPLASVAAADLAKSAGIPFERCSALLDELERSGRAIRAGADRWFSIATLRTLQRRIRELVSRFHLDQPLRLGLPPAELLSRLKPSPERTLFDAVLDGLLRDGALATQHGRIALDGHAVRLSADQAAIRDRIETWYRKAGLAPPDMAEVVAELGKEAERILMLLIESGELMLLEEGCVMHPAAVAGARERIAALLRRTGEATLGSIRQELGTTRKYAVPLMVYLDSTGFTERVGDVRRLRER